MNNLIPLQYYTPIYYLVMALFVLVVLFQSRALSLSNARNLKSKKTFGFILFLFVALYMGTRPVNFRFGDMVIYAEDYQRYKQGQTLRENGDVFFNSIMSFSSKIVSVEVFFLLCALLYVVPLYLACKRIFVHYSFYAFLMLVTSMSFWAYGTNGIRNGLATTLFIYALSFKKETIRISIMVFATFFHLSLIIPIAAYFTAKYIKNIKFLLFGWVFAILLSAALGGFFEQLFLSLGLVEEDRLVSYLGANTAVLDGLVKLKVGFRWDFIIYSGLGIYAGYYFLIKQKLQDEFYRILYGMYVIANAFWILVIRANFSNRFAYLSWFLMGLVIIYPLLKYQYFKNQHVVIGRIVLLYFVFTFILNVILAK